MTLGGIVLSVVAFALALGLVAGMIAFQKAIWKHVINYHTKPSKDGLDLNYRMK
ncbi:hypothetical protein [Herbiconiux ginsengi]|uniref:Uncharacterized protein n=1 Tax=Herbiconiux ginsengi TaxID=381665 RepID=A0A1H3S426_9MICO|nr:hypothetical protein [Herbiconiux ginsengi]SDZ32682.1 hypothetical protein SAMN05216554_3290 [Herbiconiux ginsengi]